MKYIIIKIPITTGTTKPTDRTSFCQVVSLTPPLVTPNYGPSRIIRTIRA